jgi:integrase
MSLTDRQVAGLSHPESGQKFHADGAIPGFGVRISQGGAKTFVLTIGAERRRITIGRYPIVSLAQAREKAKTILAKRHLGLDHQLTPFFSEARDQFLSSREGKIRPSTFRRDASVLMRFQALSRKRMADITPDMVQDIIDRMAAPTARSEAVQRFSSLVRHLQRKGDITHWPAERLEGRMVPRYRERVLNTPELAKVLATARVWHLSGHQYGTIVELLILTGQRRQQIAALDSSHINFEDGTITWPPELMKAGKRHTIAMGDAAKALLPKRSGLLFPNKFGQPFTFASNCDRAFRNDCGFGDWVLHDLRRTLATRWQEMGIEIVTTEKMLSHSAVTGGLVGVYQRHSYLAEMRTAVRYWEEYVQTLLPTSEGTNA